jgi:hypothetical protein
MRLGVTPPRGWTARRGGPTRLSIGGHTGHCRRAGRTFFWYAQAALVFWFLAIETKGRSIEEISGTLDVPTAPTGAAAAL